MTKSDQKHPGSVNRSQLRSESMRLDPGNGYSPKSLNQGVTPSAPTKSGKHDKRGEQRMTLSEDNGAADSVRDGLWTPESVPQPSLIGPEDVARLRLVWLTYGILATTIVGGVGAIVFLAIEAVDAAPLLQYLISVTTLEFAAAMVVLRHHFGRRKDRSKGT